MDTRSASAAIAAARDDFDVVTADTPELVREAHRLRYQVYCIERGFEPGADGLEIDEYDEHSRHVLLTHRASGEVMGAARLVLPSLEAPQDSFPIQRVCAPSLLRHVPLATVAEVSRFAISKHRRVSCSSAIFMRLGLIQGLVRLSGETGTTHWCAVMERSLLRLLQTTAIYFQPVGPLVDYHGMRQPAATAVGPMLRRMETEQPLVWDFLTEGGRLYDLPVDRQMAA